MKSLIQSEDYIAHILSNLTGDYSKLVTILEGELEGLTFDRLKGTVREFYRRKQRSERDVRENTHALLHIFKGRYNNCGVYGYRRKDCPKERSKKGERKNFSTTCNYCKKNGHIKRNCYKLKD